MCKVAYNKAFKRDSCRVAFLVCSEFCDKSDVRKVGLCGIHPLTRRYVLGGHGGISKGQGNFWRFSETCCKAVQSPRIQAFKQKREARMAASLDSRLFTNHWAL
ncbi:DUF3265 domain-containing protein [Vibrio vulnificus]|nr:DUF3265 domain-containing protein [Vibrio vulnificus]ELV8640233.1 DUF3265 domain-containing protein [Vibrio vulnificus]ELV8706517.1 DUF3265 domain-containing protein [Vibrio vulnificus]ELV8805234.1 DUF3265 domain-containing protein [Vibrio vulnificus]